MPLLEGQVLREFSTTHAQSAEDPFTIEDGHREWSMEAASGSWGRLDSLSQVSAGAGRASVKLGLPHRMEISETASGWTRESIRSTGTTPDETASGVGNFETHWKATLAGADSTTAAVGVSASVTVPGSSLSPESRAVEAAVAIPFALSLGEHASLVASSSLHRAANAEGTGHHFDWLNALDLRGDFRPGLGGFVELVSVTSGEARRPRLGVVDVGLDWEPVPHLGVGGGACAGRGAARTDVGGFAALEIHG